YPAQRPVERGIHRARQAADDQEKDERALRLPGEEQDELPRIARQHFPFRIGERFDDTFRLAPDALGKAVILAFFLDAAHSAAISFSGSAPSSWRRNPPDCLCHNWA